MVLQAFKDSPSANEMVSCDNERKALTDGDAVITTGYKSFTSSTNHCHSDFIENSVDKVARKKLIIASVLCLIFMAAEFAGGLISHSIAIATDAAHMLADFASFMISLLSLYIGSRPATRKFTFGWHRAEVIGALVSVLLIWLITGVLVYLAAERVVQQDFEIDALVMVITASLGVGVNIVMGITLHGGGHGHSHGAPSRSQKLSTSKLDLVPDSDSDPSDREKGYFSTSTASSSQISVSNKPKVNINVRAAFIHVLGDLLQSVGVLIAAIVIYFKPEWKLVDPICTFLFSILVLATTIAIMRDILRVLMEGVPRGINLFEIKSALLKVSGVLDVHDLRVWSLTMSRTACTVHIAMDRNAEGQKLLTECIQIIRKRFGIDEITIQNEHYVSDMENCNQCKT